MFKLIRHFQDDKLVGLYDTKRSIFLRPEFEFIVLCRYGITCKMPGEPRWKAFSNNAEPLVDGCKMIVFLSETLLLLVDGSGRCMIYDVTQRKLVIQMTFESVLVFIGNSNEATELNASTDFMHLATFTNYPIYGAHIESLLCAKIGKWGVIDIATGGIVKDFTHTSLKHTKGNNIAEID